MKERSIGTCRSALDVGTDACYARGGGESGTKVESSGFEANLGDEPAGTSGAIEEAAKATTAGGPISEAAIAVTGSDVLRQEHECDDEPVFDFVCTWCIGHICPSPCSQVHSAPTAPADIAHKAVGTDTSRQHWNTSQPAATRASRIRIQRMKNEKLNTARNQEARECARIAFVERRMPRGLQR